VTSADGTPAPTAPPGHRGLGRFVANLGRALAGALVFGLPLLMTMEMWWLGFYMDRPRLALLLVLTLPLLVGLSHFVGFEETFGWREDARDALVALAVGAAASGAVLWVFGVLEPGMSADEVVGKVALQTVPASIGALLARSQLGGGGDREERRWRPGYAGELFLMAVGALFLSLNVAPTEEMVLIAYMMPVERELTLAVLSVLTMHAFVYAVDFRGQEERPRGATAWGLFLRYSVAGYAVVLLVSLYALWTFGRLDGTGGEELVSAAVVLGFPGAIGAAGARLIL
jgi:putative integral membrane protein (TIGR02587 family)